MSQKLIFKIGEESIPTILKGEEAKASPFADAITSGLQKLKTAVMAIPDEGSLDVDKDSRNSIIPFLG